MSKYPGWLERAYLAKAAFPRDLTLADDAIIRRMLLSGELEHPCERRPHDIPQRRWPWFRRTAICRRCGGEVRL